MTSRFRFQLVRVPMHNWVPPEDREKVKDAFKPEIAERLRKGMAEGRLPAGVQHVWPKAGLPWQRRVTLCKGRAITNLMNQEFQDPDFPKVLAWQSGITLGVWWRNHVRGLLRRTVHLYGGSPHHRYINRFNGWVRDPQSVMVAHRSLVWPAGAKNASITDFSPAPEILFPEPFWDIDHMVSALRLSVKTERFPVYNVRFFALQDTLDEEIVRWIMDRTIEKIS